MTVAPRFPFLWSGSFFRRLDTDFSGLIVKGPLARDLEACPADLYPVSCSVTWPRTSATGSFSSRPRPRAVLEVWAALLRTGQEKLVFTEVGTWRWGHGAGKRRGGRSAGKKRGEAFPGEKAEAGKGPGFLER